MKKLYFLLLTFLVTFYGYSQSPILTMISDGDCTGGNPKVLEIYADGTVDFSLYSLQNQTNANTTWSTAASLSSLGTVTDDFVYVYYDSNNNTTLLDQEYPSSIGKQRMSSSLMNLNGDDRVRIIVTSSTTVIDQYGVSDVDGTDTAWEWLDGYAKRNNGTGPDAGFVLGNWTYSKQGLDTKGLCQSSDSFQTVMGGIQTYTPTSSGSPSLSILSPSSSQIFNPETTSVDVSFSVQNFTVANGTGDGHIQYTVDAGSVQSKYDTDAINVTGLSSGSHTVYMELVDNSAQVLSPAVNASVTFEIAIYTTVANLAQLRASVLNGYYQVTGEVVATFAQTFNNQKWGQDSTAGIMIHDPNVVVTTAYNLGDGISGAKGQLIAYNQLLEFVPTVDFGAPTSTGNVITPEVVTLADLNANVAAYESELVKIMQVTVSDLATGGDGTFLTGKNYPITDASGSGILRTQFYDADYITQTLPTAPVDAVCIVGNYSGTAQVTPRSLADISLKAGGIVNIDGFSMYPNPAKNQLTIRTTDNLTKNVQIFNVLGKQVLAKTMTGNTLDINLPTGIYVVKVEEAGKIATQKLMVQ